MTKKTPSGVKALQEIQAELIEARREADSYSDAYRELYEVSMEVTRAFIKGTPSARRNAYKLADDALKKVRPAKPVSLQGGIMTSKSAGC